VSREEYKKQCGRCVYFIIILHKLGTTTNKQIPSSIETLATHLIITHSTRLSIMASLSTFSTTVPLRVAARPQTYLFLAVRTYSGVAASTINSSCLARHHASPLTYTPKRLISSTPQPQIKEFFPPPANPAVKEVASAWSHPM
jgi:hypothetical protein